MSKRDDPIELPTVRAEVRRNDGTLEYDAETDAFSVLCEDIRARVRSLVKLPAYRFQRRRVLAFIATAKGAGGKLELFPTAVLPSNDPELAAAMLFGALLYVRKVDPAAFERAMGKLRDGGLVQPAHVGPKIVTP